MRVPAILRRLRSSVLLRLLVPVLVVALVWTLADSEDTLRRLGTLSWGWLVLAVIALNLQIVLSALRWRMVATALGAPLTRRGAIGEYYLAQLVNQTVPGGVVGDAARAVRAREGRGLGQAAQGVIIERLAGQLALWGVLLVGLAVSMVRPGGLVGHLNPAIWLSVLALLGGVALLALVARGGRRLFGGFGAASWRALFAPGVRWRQGAISLAIVACNLSGFAFAAEATGTRLTLEETVTLVPLILTAMLIPATIAGWGYREGAAAALFPLAGASAAAGLAASLAFGVAVLAASLPGLFVVLRRRDGRAAQVARTGEAV